MGLSTAFLGRVGRHGHRCPTQASFQANATEVPQICFVPSKQKLGHAHSMNHLSSYHPIRHIAAGSMVRLCWRNIGNCLQLSKFTGPSSSVLLTLPVRSPRVSGKHLSLPCLEMLPRIALEMFCLKNLGSTAPAYCHRLYSFSLQKQILH